MRNIVPVLPFAVPGLAAAPQFEVPAIEKSIAQIDFDLWIQPDLGNDISPAPRLQVASRVGGHVAKSTDPDVTFAAGMGEGVPVVRTPSGSSLNVTPFGVEGFTLSDSFTIAMVVRVDAAAPMSQVQTLFSAGIPGTNSSLLIFFQSGNLSVRMQNGIVLTSDTAPLAAGGEYLIVVSYDSAFNVLRAFVNDTAPLTWDREDGTLGIVGTDGGVVFGAKPDAAGTGSTQGFDGEIRAVWINAQPWANDSFALLRERFIGWVAQSYAGIVLT